MNKKIKLGVIGGGINSAVGYAHFCASRLDSNFIYHKGFFSRNSQINEESAHKYGVDLLNIYSNLDDIIECDFDIDCWLILTPTPTHYDILVKLEKTGKPVICEKALCSSLEDSESIIKLYTKDTLYVIYNYTGYPMVREAREIIKLGKIGKLITINIEMPQSGFIKKNKEGVIPQPQEWRLKDDEISTISLDLGVHIHSLINYLCDIEPVEVFAICNSLGLNEEIIDNVFAILSFKNEAIGNIWYTKTALGNTNGLKFRIYGTNGSIEWLQKNPDELIFSDMNGIISIIEMSNNFLIEANNSNYNRFKPGHPSGFIEALANYYNSIYNAIQFNNNNHLFLLEDTLGGMKLMHAINQSISSKTLIKL